MGYVVMQCESFCSFQDGKTPLNRAIDKGQLEIVRALLGAGADANFTDEVSGVNVGGPSNSSERCKSS